MMIHISLESAELKSCSLVACLIFYIECSGRAGRCSHGHACVIMMYVTLVLIIFSNTYMYLDVLFLSSFLSVLL